MKKRKRLQKATPQNRRVSGEKPDLVEAGKATRFQPGTSGNPLGRPPTKIFRDMAREIVALVDTKTKKARARKLMDAAFKEAEKGSLGHFKYIHRLLEEDSTQTRVALSAEGDPPKKKLSLEELFATVRSIYGLSEPDDKPLIEAACQKSPNARELLD